MAVKASFSKKILREIEKAYESEIYDFFCDEQGVYDDPGCCYLRFTSSADFYENQVHILQIKFIYGNGEYVYPTSPPNVLFLTPIWHTNINASAGLICLDVIKSDAWSPFYCLDAVITSIMLLLAQPNTSSPFNIDASKQYEQYIEGVNADGRAIGRATYKKICQDYYAKKVITNVKAQSLLNAPEWQR
jgi:ubiquitin-protein ligase